MKRIVPLLALLSAAAVILPIIAQEQKAKSKPLKALLVAGGCCHDYAGQHKALFEGIQARANVQVDVFWTDDKSVNPPLPLYDDPKWADGYDVIIHDECAAGNKDKDVLKRILDAHKTVPAVHLHCAMHSFRVGNDDWFKHLGLKSTGHGPQVPIKVEFVDEEHPVTKPLENWETGKEELYNNVELHTAHPLAMGTQVIERNGEKKEAAAVVVWTNEATGARSFSTSLGHNTFTVEDDRYLNLVTRGLLWATDQLNDNYFGVPFEGENKITFVPKSEAPKPAPPKAAEAPKDATLVTMSASTEETGKNNFAWRAVDGDPKTRWCASSSKKPEWLQLAFDEPMDVDSVGILWEQRQQWYQYTIETSIDGKSWKMAADQSKNEKGGDTNDTIDAKGIKFLKVTVLKQEKDLWSSLWELQLKGPKIKSIFPKLDEKTAARLKNADKMAKSGNIKPEIVELTPDERKKILDNVKVPEGFDVSIFSSWQAANYPVYVAASPSGDLYVSSDGNGSLGREPDRGRVLRLRDKDGDGEADEVTEFVPNIDSPRGLIWDQDRLYLLHPPHISVFYDRDGDGVSEDSERLISDIAFGFKDRPADHTTNSLEMGIDGWIYIAGGDFGFMKAVGTDGRQLQHRNGGVVRFRPDGSGLEIFATGTRNILGVPVSPLLDAFARDNTNDGGGWNVRFHHFAGLADHGYPRMYKNFNDEIIQPLADYGGGSGCGSVYLAEPGFPDEWNNAPLTCDWGTGGLWHHSVERRGAGFIETTEPKKLISMTRPTDADVDGMSAIYQASWIGPATFKWAGAEQGYIARVTPSGYTPDPILDFNKASEDELIELLATTESQVRRIAAQRALLKRDENPNTVKKLEEIVRNADQQLPGRIAALYALSQRAINDEFSSDRVKLISSFNKLDAAIQPFVNRALGDLGQQLITEGKAGAVAGGILNFGIANEQEDPRTTLEAIVAAARQNRVECADTISTYLASEDPVIAHTAFQALAKLKAHEVCFKLLRSTEHRVNAARALMRIHEDAVVDGAIERLESETISGVRQQLLAILCRLYHREAEWTGQSWGTRPDTRGPYYQPETWDASERILTTLKSTLAAAEADEAAFLVREMNRNRIQSNDALERIIELASADDKVIPDAVAQIATQGTPPAAGIPILFKAAAMKDASATTLSQALIGLSKIDDPKVITASIGALDNLLAIQGSNKEHAAGMNAFLKSPKLENHHLAIEKMAAEDFDTPENRWANIALIELASRTKGSPESREMSAKAIDKAWEDPKHRLALIKTIDRNFKSRYLDARILIALSDADAEIAKAAESAAKTLRLQLPGDDKTPKVATLKPDEAVKQIVAAKGNAALGEAVFTRAACTNCHTVSEGVPQKGPYLGNIAQTYKRLELTEAIIIPSKTIAQGFKTNVITLKDDSVHIGFVTDEAGETVTMRDIAAQESTFKKADIAKRETNDASMMPPMLVNNFTVNEVASLVTYLEELAKKK